MKKKVLSLTLAICIALSLFAGMTFNVGAETVSGTCGDNLTWEYDTSTQTLTISGTGEMSNYTDSFYDSTYVTSAPWRNYYKSMKTLVINNGVTLIGDYAFYGCTGLTSIEIPDSVTSIGCEAFYECDGLEKVYYYGSKEQLDCEDYFGSWIRCYYYGEEPTYEYEISDGEAKITKFNKNYYGTFIIPDLIEGFPVTEISYDAFASSGITNVTIPDTVTKIGWDAFSGCSELTDITIPDSVKVIDVSAFSGCTGLKSVKISSSVEEIDRWAFNGCSGIESITVDSGNPIYHSKDNCLIHTEEGYLKLGCKNSVIPSDGSVTAIGQHAFDGCTGLTSIEIPDSVTSIEFSAFSGCTGLTSITIPDSVEWISENAFEECTALESVVIGDNVKRIIQSSFARCTAIKNLKIGKSVSEIEAGTFCGSNDLEKIEVSSENKAFKAQNNCLIEVDSGTIIKGGNNSVIPNDGSIKTIGSWAFSECKKLKNIEIPASVTSIGAGAFSECTGLTSITIPNSVTAIGDFAFESCSELTSITIPNSVTSIGDSAFADCAGLTSVSIPDSVTRIGYDAFSWCKELSDIIVGNSVCSIGAGAFSWTEWYENQPDGLVYAGKVVYAYKGECPENIEIKDGTLGIAGGAFERCTSLTNITLPDSLKCISSDSSFYGAFSGCTGLTEINIPNGVEIIGDSAFYNCSKLTGVVIPDSVTRIDDWAFYHCQELQSVILGNSVTDIGTFAFSNCPKLETFVIGDSVTSFWFDDISSVKNLTIGASLAEINAYQLRNLKNLENVTVKEGNKKYHSANNCIIETESKTLIYGMKNSVIPSDGSVTKIGDFAFESCSELTSIEIPHTVTSIGYSAFAECTGLKDVYYSGSKFDKYKMRIVYGNENLKNATWHFAASTEEGNFPDVNYKDWYGDSVGYSVATGLMTGYANGKFGTTDGIQRQDFVVILARLSGANLNAYKGQKAFKDVDPNAYYAPALAWAKANGVSSGYNDGSFGVGKKVTREQIMTFLHNYAKLKGYDVTVEDYEKEFISEQYSDFKNVSSYAQEATYWALKNGVISGKEVNGKRYISPSANAQRCEVAAMFYNINQNNIFAEE